MNNLDYLILTKEGENLIIGEFAIDKYSEELDGFNVLKKIKGKEIVGLSYDPIFPYFKDEKNAFKILSGEFVNTEEGTGVVHMAPGFGDDDQIICEKNSFVE